MDSRAAARVRVGVWGVTRPASSWMWMLLEPERMVVAASISTASSLTTKSAFW